MHYTLAGRIRAVLPGQPGNADPRLGLRENWRQFVLLVAVNGFVGGMVGLERTVVPLLAEQDFGLASKATILSFILSFGIVKALSNLLAGHLADRLGRRRILLAGWLAGLPVPFIIMLAPSWSWVVFANVLLGLNQGLCWSATIIMKIDLVGPARRGLAMGLNECAGYLAISLAALASGYLAASYGLRPVPFLLGVAFSVAGLGLSLFFVRETHGHVRHEAALSEGMVDAASQTRLPGALPFLQVFVLTSWKDRTLFSASQAGMMNNLNDGVAWGLFPLLFVAAGLSLEYVSLLVAVYPGVWAVAQVAAGGLSDVLGRKVLIVAGMWAQAGAYGLLALTHGFAPWLAAMVLLGLGTAMVYPTLLAVVSDVAQPAWRASAVGVYRLWRDAGYALGAVFAGVLADRLGLLAAIAGVGGLTFLSGVLVALVMYETRPARRGALHRDE